MEDGTTEPIESSAAPAAPTPFTQYQEYYGSDLFADLGDDDFWHGLSGVWNPMDQQPSLLER